MNEQDLNESVWRTSEYKEMNALQELERFQTDRLLHTKEFNLKIATMNILEEIFEAYGVADSSDRMIATSFVNMIEQEVSNSKGGYWDDRGVVYHEPTVEDIIDALCDIQVFAGGEVTKLGYSNEQCLIEVGKEINSRTGEIINGKFEKYKTEEAMSKWYKADFTNCKL